MRVIAGKFKGRQLKAVPGKRTRPTTDRVKESLFNILGPYFKGGYFLDLFAGSGNVGIEAVSRGIQKSVLVDHQYLAYKTILANVSQTGLSNQFVVKKANAKTALRQLTKQKIRFNYVYLDPPYRLQRMQKDLITLDHLHLLKPQALVICETNRQTTLPKIINGYRSLQQKQYGVTLITIYRYLRKSL